MIFSTMNRDEVLEKLETDVMTMGKQIMTMGKQIQALESERDMWKSKAQDKMESQA